MRNEEFPDGGFFHSSFFILHSFPPRGNLWNAFLLPPWHESGGSPIARFEKRGILTPMLSSTRSFLEKLLFPGWAIGQRRRHMRFFLLSLVLGSILCVAFGVALDFANVCNPM